MPVISNSSPLIALTQIGRLDLVRQLHSSVSIPPAVAKEVLPTLPKLPDWVVVQELTQPLQPATVSSSIGPGEREVISLGLELKVALLILDEQPARRLATSLRLQVIGTVGLLMAGKERGFIAKIRPELDGLLAVSRRVIPKLLANREHCGQRCSSSAFKAAHLPPFVKGIRPSSRLFRR